MELLSAIVGTVIGGLLLKALKKRYGLSNALLYSGLILGVPLTAFLLFTEASGAGSSGRSMGLFVPADSEVPSPPPPTGESGSFPGTSPPPQPPLRLSLETLLGKSRQSLSGFLARLGDQISACRDGGNCLVFQEKGIDLAFDGEWRLEKIVVYSGATPEYKAYDESLASIPQNLGLHLTRKEVAALLGQPDHGDTIWCEYDYDQYKLCFDFDSQGRILMVSIIRKPVETAASDG